MARPSLSFSSISHCLVGSRLALGRHLPLAIAIAVLGACATSPQGRTQLTTPAPISDVYSDVNMRVQLATAKSISTPCAADDCGPNKEFNQQVQALGEKLAKSAFNTYPDLSKRVSHFEFVVAEKEELGSTSNASGKIVIFRGLQELYLDEQALAFVLAREMGHVVGGHHDENTGTSILISVLVGVLFPAANLFHGAALANATSSTTITTTAATTAASSATSFAGSQVLLASVKPDQLLEADIIAVKLLAGLGWSGRDTADILGSCTQINGNSAWDKDFRISLGNAVILEDEIAVASTQPEVNLVDFQVAQDTSPKIGANSSGKIDLKTEGGNNVVKVDIVPVTNENNESKPVAMAGEQAAGSSEITANVPEEKVSPDGAAIVAENEAGTPLDIVTTDALTLAEVEAEEAKLENESLVEDETDNELADQSPKATSYQAAKVRAQSMNVQSRDVKKASPASKSNLTKKSGKALSKTASKKVTTKKTTKVAARSTKLKLTKSTSDTRQGGTRKLYASTAKNTKVTTSAGATRKNKSATAQNDVKPRSVKSELDKIKQVKAPQIKLQ